MNNVLLSAVQSISQNMEINNPLLTAEMLVWGIIGGLLVGAVLTVLSRRSLYLFIKALKAAGASVPEKAVSLADLGMEKNVFLKMALQTGKPLRRYSLCANEDEFLMTKPAGRGGVIFRKIFSLPEAEAKAVTDFARARFYMPDEERYVAEVRYGAKGADLIGLIFSAAILLALGFLVQWVLPEVMQFLDGILTVR